MKKIIFIGLLVSIMLLAVAAISARAVVNLNVFDISPNPMVSNTRIDLDFSGPCFVSVWIEEDGGAIIKHLYSGHINKSVQLSWNRMSNSGIYVPAGTYSVVVNYEGRYTSTKKTLILK